MRIEITTEEGEALSVLLRAIEERTAELVVLRLFCDQPAVEIGGKLFAHSLGKTACTAVLRCYRTVFGVDGYRGGRADEMVRRIARDILAGKPPRHVKRRARRRTKRERKP